MPSPVEKTNQVTSNDQLNVYKDSDRDEDSGEGERIRKKNTWRMRKIIHTEFESDDDVDERANNSSNVQDAEGKVRVRKKIIHYYEISSDEEEGKHALTPKKVKDNPDGHENQQKK